MEGRSSEPVLASELLQAGPAVASRTIYALHGIYGRGRNWAGVARQMLERRPDWRWVLVDLRAHGRSPDLSPPHTIAAVAADVLRLARARELPVDAVLGHSFGGKVALQLAAAAPNGLRQVWVIDSTPASKVPDGDAWHMLEAARALPGPFESRDEVVSALRGARIAPPVAAWMATHVDWEGGLYRWRLDFDLMEALLHDFFRLDLWRVVEDPPDGLMLHVVKAARSDLLSEASCARIEHAARDHGRVQLHRVDGGHWLNADNPEALVALLARELPRRFAAPGH